MLARLSAALLVLGLVACTAPNVSGDVQGSPSADDDDDATADAPSKKKKSSGSADDDDGADDGHAPSTTPSVPHKTDLFTKTAGDPKNPAIIYVHGGPGGNGTMFEDTIAPTLAAKGLFAVSYDQRGSGRSPKGTKEEFTIAKFVQDLDDVIFTLKLEKPVLIGHSWGGTLSMKYQEAHPDKVAGTVLVGNPIDYPDSLSNIHDRCLAHYESSFFADDDIKSIKDLHARMFPNGLTGPFNFASADIGQTMMAAGDCNLYFPAMSDAIGSGATWASLMLTSPDKDLLMGTEPAVGAGLSENEKDLFNGTQWDLLGKVKSKVFAIYGSEDGLFSTGQVNRLKSTIGSDHFTLVDGASHVVFVDDPDAFTNTFLKYVSALRAK